ncbi:hypothetical protein TWF696_002730 [Orbilia brochopaga]|uniref:Uncharacterized protein n=1 Tax=Orbilia brochopaga TaxID=3140254 RepID=A0AAV9U0H0_9PEZI
MLHKYNLHTYLFTCLPDIYQPWEARLRSKRSPFLVHPDGKQKMSPPPPPPPPPASPPSTDAPRYEQRIPTPEFASNALSSGDGMHSKQDLVAEVADQEAAAQLATFEQAPAYRIYRRRWLGLITLMLMNIMISWGWIAFAPVSESTRLFFRLEHVSSVNWLSTVILLSYICISPLAIYSLNRFGVRAALIFAAGFSVAGVWLRYVGARVNSSNGGHFVVVMLGQILIGFGQPFVLGAPAFYSDLWFTSKGRVTANALISLSNPLGAALGQLIDPFLVAQPGDIPNMLLYTAIITTVVTSPILAVQSRPPTPPCPSAAQEKLPFRSAIFKVAASLEFWLIFIMVWFQNLTVSHTSIEFVEARKGLKSYVISSRFL